MASEISDKSAFTSILFLREKFGKTRSFQECRTDAFETFLCHFFPALKQGDGRKMIPVVRKTDEKGMSDKDEPPEKVANRSLSFFL